MKSFMSYVLVASVALALVFTCAESLNVVPQADSPVGLPHGHYCANWGSVNNVHLDVLSLTEFHFSCQVLLTPIDCRNRYRYDPVTHVVEMLDWQDGGCMHDSFQPYKMILGELTLSYDPKSNTIMTHSKLGDKAIVPCDGSTKGDLTEAQLRELFASEKLPVE